MLSDTILLRIDKKKDLPNAYIRIMLIIKNTINIFFFFLGLYTGLTTVESHRTIQYCGQIFCIWQQIFVQYFLMYDEYITKR